jgi:hypothetical protein
MPKTTLLLPIVAALCALSGCGNGDFTGAHFEELQKDCTEKLRCVSGSQEHADVDQMQKCVDVAGQELGKASGGVQQEFVDTVARCALLQVCDYVSCSQTDPNTGYAQLHRPDIVTQCMEIVGCQVTNGQRLATTAVDDCIAQTSNQLNFGTTLDQQHFEAKALKCRGLTGCAWANCQ